VRKTQESAQDVGEKTFAKTSRKIENCKKNKKQTKTKTTKSKTTANLKKGQIMREAM
jgi:hypothetical protein